MHRCLVVFVTCLVWCLPTAALAQRPPAVVPDRADTVLERLPRGYAALAPSAGGAPLTLAQIQQLLATAARTGDARLAARAEASLARFPARGATPAVLGARAYLAQHRHEFNAALALLDRLIRDDPRDADAHLTHAQILLVQGHLDRAREDCVALALGVDVGRGLLCVAAISLRRGDTAAAAGVLDRWLAAAERDDSSLRYVLVTRGEVASRARAADADAWFQRALALAPDDVRTLAAYARHLRATGRNADASRLLASAPNTDALQLQRALAADAAGRTDAPALIAAQARRYELAHAVGSQPELRDEAEFLLTLRGDAAGALVLAQRNFAAQRDYEDVDVLRRAAIAAKNPQALQPLRDWAASQQLALPPLRGDRP